MMTEKRNDSNQVNFSKKINDDSNPPKSKKRLNVDIDNFLYTRLKIAAAESETTISALISKMVSDFLDKENL